MDTAAARNPAVPPLLVRRAAAGGERDVAALLRDVHIGSLEVADLMRRHGVLILSDLTLPPTAPPVAAVAFRFHRPTRTAQLAGIAVRLHLRRRGLARRLLTGALTWLRADGYEQVWACATPGGAGVSLLASAGFTTGGDTTQADGCSRFLLLL